MVTDIRGHGAHEVHHWPTFGIRLLGVTGPAQLGQPGGRPAKARLLLM
jgi:hypothetical protein